MFSQVLLVVVDAPKTDVLFYHLERRGLDSVLPQLLEKTLERGWRAVVQSGSDESAAALDLALWTYRDDSFLPHGLRGHDHAEDQPILLTAAPGAENGAQIQFLVDGAEAGDMTAFERVVFLFDGGDDAAVGAARTAWKAAKAAECNVTYWQENADGQWQKKA